MQTQGRRGAEQTLPGAGGVPPPLCEAHRPARTFSRPQDSITVTAGRSAACWEQRHRIPSEGQRRRHSPQPTTQQGAGRPPRGRCCDCQRRPGTGGRQVSVSPATPAGFVPALPCPAMDAFFSTTQLSVAHGLKAGPLSPSSDAAPLGSEAPADLSCSLGPVTAVTAVTVFFLLLLLHRSPAAGALPPCLCTWHFCSGRMGGCLRGLSSPPMGLAPAMGRLGMLAPGAWWGARPLDAWRRRARCPHLLGGTPLRPALCHPQDGRMVGLKF